MMRHTRLHSHAHRHAGTVVWVLAAAALIGLGGEALRSGHHVHLGDEELHHHHFFVGDHDHASSIERAHGHHHDEDRAYRHDVDQDDGGRPEPAPDQDASPGLTAAGFAFDASSPDAGFTASLPATASVRFDSGTPVLENPARLPGGARGPPSSSLV
ncbi:MAG TPA: hypothetical protein VGG06_02500 [Thermoanaerobaculia bacterium]|jgi:hypothetical protein